MLPAQNKDMHQQTDCSIEQQNRRDRSGMPGTRMRFVGGRRVDQICERPVCRPAETNLHTGWR